VVARWLLLASLLYLLQTVNTGLEVGTHSYANAGVLVAAFAPR